MDEQEVVLPILEKVERLLGTPVKLHQRECDYPNDTIFEWKDRTYSLYVYGGMEVLNFYSFGTRQNKKRVELGSDFSDLDSLARQVAWLLESQQ